MEDIAQVGAFCYAQADDGRGGLGRGRVAVSQAGLEDGPDARFVLLKLEGAGPGPHPRFQDGQARTRVRRAQAGQARQDEVLKVDAPGQGQGCQELA